MSDYYKPHRNPNWNYGGARWKLSRSKIDLFMNCPRCFYVDNKLGTARPRGFPFNLNSAVDALFKKEFDVHRAAQTKHPILEQYNIDAVPFQHENMDTWRENFEGVQTNHKPTGFTISGAVDDIWVNPKGAIHVVDYKATSKAGTIDALDQDWHIGYKRQMEVYQWLLRQNGLSVSDSGYFVYANATVDREAFDNKLDFEVTLIEYKGDDSWIEPTLVNIKSCLDDPRVPSASQECEYCQYREAAGKVLLKSKQERTGANADSAEPAAPKKNDTLF